MLKPSRFIVPVTDETVLTLAGEGGKTHLYIQQIFTECLLCARHRENKIVTAVTELPKKSRKKREAREAGTGRERGCRPVSLQWVSRRERLRGR